MPTGAGRTVPASSSSLATACANRSGRLANRSEAAAAIELAWCGAYGPLIIGVGPSVIDVGVEGAGHQHGDTKTERRDLLARASAHRSRAPFAAE